MAEEKGVSPDLLSDTGTENSGRSLLQPTRFQPWLGNPAYSEPVSSCCREIRIYWAGVKPVYFLKLV